MTRPGIILTMAALAAGPAAAATEGTPFFSLYNTDIVVAIAFLIFIGILVYYRVPGMLGGMLDKRADAIRAELDEARALREEAQELRASYERKIREAEAQAKRIVERAREEAEQSAEEAKENLQRSIERRMQAAEDQIASAEAGAIRDVRNEAARVAVAAAGDVLSGQMSAQKANALITEGIETVEARLH